MFRFTTSILKVAVAICPLTLLLLSSIPDNLRKILPADKQELIVLTPSRPDKNSRPQVPSKQRIWCTYDGEYLTLNFVVPEGECEVTLTEWYTNAEQTYTIDSTPLVAEIYVGALYESTLTISTEKGNTYTADLTADPADE